MAPTLLVGESLVTAAIPETISPQQATAARDTLGGALSVAGQLADPAAAANLLLAAQNAFTTAVQITSVVAALISIVTAVAVAIYIGADRRVPVQAEPDEIEYSLAACMP